MPALLFPGSLHAPPSLPERGSGENRSLRGREHDPSFSCYLEHHWTLLVPFAGVSILFPKLFICIPIFECVLFNNKTLASQGFCTMCVSQHSAGHWNQYFTKLHGEKSLPGLGTPPNLLCPCFLPDKIASKRQRQKLMVVLLLFSFFFPIFTNILLAWN